MKTKSQVPTARSLNKVQKALDWWEGGDKVHPTLFTERRTGGRLKSADYLVPGDVLKALVGAARELVKSSQ